MLLIQNNNNKLKNKRTLAFCDFRATQLILRNGSSIQSTVAQKIMKIETVFLIKNSDGEKVYSIFFFNNQLMNTIQLENKLNNKENLIFVLRVARAAQRGCGVLHLDLHCGTARLFSVLSCQDTN